MVSRRFLLKCGAAGAVAAGWPALAGAAAEFEVTHTDAEWRQILSPEAYDVLRRSGTEYPFTSPLLNEHRKGTFACAGCALALFASMKQSAACRNRSARFSALSPGTDRSSWLRGQSPVREMILQEYFGLKRAMHFEGVRDDLGQPDRRQRHHHRRSRRRFAGRRWRC